MADYTKLRQEQWQALARQFGVEAQSCEPLKGGRANTSYRLQGSGAQFVLTICDEKSPAEAQQMAHLLEYLGNAGLPTPKLFRTAGGELLASHEGRPVVLKSYAQGEVVPLAEGRLKAVGAVLAQLHALPAPEKLPRRFAYGLESFQKVIDRPDSGEFGAWLAAQQRRLNRLEQRDLPRGLIHGDLFWDNLVWTGDQLTLLDFEEACHYWLGFDLGMTTVGACYRPEGEWLSRARALVGGYQQQRRLSTDERESLQDLAVYAATATASWRFWQYNVVMPVAQEREAYREMVEVAEAIAAVDGEEFQLSVGGETW